jgi:DNA-binding transcriptional LysR family regulator
MEMDLNKLRHVVAVAREGSFIAAASALPLSQSALTRSIQSLERDAGFSIFERGRSGVVLTKGGAELVQLAEDLLARSEHATREITALREGIRMEPVRMGVGSVTAAAIMPSLLPKILDRCPTVHLRVDTNSRLNWMLAHNELDFYIGGVPADSGNFATANRFEARNFEGGSTDLLVRLGHPLLESARSPDEFSRYPIAAGTFVTETWAQPFIQGLVQQPTLITDDYSLLALMAKRSDYILIASKLLANLRPDLGLTVLASIPSNTFLRTKSVLMSSRRELMTPNARYAADVAFAVVQTALKT